MIKDGIKGWNEELNQVEDSIFKLIINEQGEPFVSVYLNSEVEDE